MDLFINTVDPDKFRATNAPWNDMGLNSRNNIGTVTKLISEKVFKNKEEWEEYYYEHGRSKEYLAGVGKRLYDEVRSTVDISLEECIECVRYRTVCETWNGIMLREPNTIKTLQTITNNKFDFRKTEGDFDCDYAVDFEMFNGDELLCGLQIKPESYYSEEEYLLKARKINEKKNKKYEQKFNVEVFTITAIHTDDFKRIRKSFSHLKFFWFFFGKMPLETGNIKCFMVELPCKLLIHGSRLQS